MRGRRGGVSWFTLLMIVLMVGGTMLVYRFGPYYWDYWQMKEVTKSTARTWKMFGRQAGLEKLNALIEEKNLSDYLDSAFCDLIEHHDGVRVQCSWEVDVYYPFSDSYRTLSFRTEHFES